MKTKEAQIQTIISKGDLIFDQKSISRLTSLIREIWGYRSLNRNDLIKRLIKDGFLCSFSMVDSTGEKFYYYYSPSKKIDIFDIAAARSPISHFSFYTALSIHGLTLQIPKQIYLTYERIKDENASNHILTQSAIDKAFSKKPRITQNKRTVNEYTINLINGQYQRRTGIITYRNNNTVTDLERTLIDIAVRPFYSGGVTQVLEAFINAKEKVNILKLVAYYQNMNLFYPYHQTIGFYMEKAQYPEVAFKPFQEMKQDFKFYLTYNMSNPLFSDRWNLFYPKGL